MATLSRHIVDTALEEGQAVDRQSRIAQLEKQLAKVNKDIAEQERLERRWQLLETAFKKLRRELGKTLTREEYNALDGAYIFLHSGCVDLLRHVPAATSRGEDKQLQRDLDMVEAMHELADLTK